MKELNKILQEKLNNLPSVPGVYKFKDKDGRVIYVGKAKNLKNRVKTYFQKTDKPVRTEKLVENTEDLEWIEVNSELESFLLETNLIKQLLPKYNILMKDGKNFSYLKICVQDLFPRVEIVRQIEKDGAKYFGPKLSSKGLHDTVRMLQEVYPIVSNNIYLVNSYPKKLDSKAKITALDGVSLEEYKKAISATLDFFHGKSESVEKALQEKMMAYAKDGKFETAARLRDMLLEFKKTLEKQIISEVSSASQDIFGFFKTEDKVFATLFQVRNGKMISSENFTFSGSGEEEEILDALISQYYAVTGDLPKEVLLPKEIENPGILEDFFEKNFDKKIKIHLPQKGKKSKLVELAETNAENFGNISEDKDAKDKEKIKRAFSDISKALGIESSFKRMECYDISHFNGDDTVASMVTFSNGVPNKSEYKKFELKTIQKGEIDDFKSMNEVLTRRLKELENSLQQRVEVAQFEYKKLKKSEIASRKKEKGERGKGAEAEAKKMCHTEPVEVCQEKGDSSTSSEGQEKGFDLIAYQVVKNTKPVGLVSVYKYDAKTFEVDFEKSEFEGEISELKKDFLLKSGELFPEKNLWICESLQNSEGSFYLENGFKKLKTLDGDLKKERGLVPKLIAEHSPNSTCNGGAFLHRLFGKKAWKAEIPNLILIDGGKGQLSVVVDAFLALGWKKKEGVSIFEKEINGEVVEIILCSLAKKQEEVFVAGESNPIDLKNTCDGSFLFQRMRDEAHRFAITFQKGKRTKSLFQ